MNLIVNSNSANENSKYNCITVSVNYSDILDIILPQNYIFFKKWYIITQEDDQKTIDIIKKYNYPNVKILYFNFTKNATFNKSGGINYGLSYIKENEKVLILDSDIFLTNDFKKYLQLDLEEDTLYSFERYDYHTYKNFTEDKYDLKYPINFAGYFQLFVYKSYINYPNSDNCRDADMSVHVYFKKLKLIIDENIIIKHLGCNNMNHFGRKSTDDFMME